MRRHQARKSSQTKMKKTRSSKKAVKSKQNMRMRTKRGAMRRHQARRSSLTKMKKTRSS